MMVGRVAFAMVLGPGEMDWNIVLCNESVFIELMSVQFFNHNDWVKTSFHFIENGGGGRVLPLQWFSVVVKWIEIWFLALHPSPSNYWILIFSTTKIGWKLHFIFYPFDDCFSLCTYSSIFYTFVDCFSPCTHSSSLYIRRCCFFLWCNHSSFFFFVYPGRGFKDCIFLSAPSQLCPFAQDQKRSGSFKGGAGGRSRREFQRLMKSQKQT